MMTPRFSLPCIGALFLTLIGTASAEAATQVGSAPYKLSVTGAGNSYAPLFSADGKHVAFVSHANNLVTNDDLAPHLDLFVRDLVASNTVLVSVSTNGFGGANDNIGIYTLSSNAQVIAFETLANNLAPGDTNRWRDIYVRDLASGVTRLITPNANGPSSNPLISEDGQRVIFESLASNLVTNDFNGTNDIFIHDLTTGVTELVTLNASNTASPDGPSHSPSISADGLIVAFISRATNLVENLIHAKPEVYARDIIRRVNMRAAADIYINSASGTYSPTHPYSPNSLTLSKSGRYANFQTPGQFIRFDFLRPTNFVTTHSNATPPNVALVYYSFADNPRLVSGAEGTRHGQSVIGNDSRFMVHETRGNWFGHRGLVHTDLETMQSITYEIDPWGCCGLVTKTIPLLSLVLSNASFFPQTWSNMNLRKITDDGSRVFYVRDSAIITNGIMAWLNDFYVLDTSNRVERLLLSYADIGDAFPAISEDGKYIAWDSVNSSIVSDDLNRAWDVFVRNVDTGETTLVSVLHPTLPAVTSTSLAKIDTAGTALSADGGRLAVLSLDGIMVPDETNRLRDLFLIDRSTGDKLQAPRPLSPSFPFQTLSGDALAPVMSTNGRYVAYGVGTTSFSVTNRGVVWLDTESVTNPALITPVLAGNSVPAMSADGRLVAFHSPATLDWRYSDANGSSDVFIRVMPQGDLASCGGTDPRAVSLAWSRAQTGNGASFNPVFSPDSRWLLFESLSTVLLPQPLPAQTSAQLYARSIASPGSSAFDCAEYLTALSNSPAVLLSYTAVASPFPPGFSTTAPLPDGGRNPRFSADSRYVFFESASGAVYRHDLSIDLVEQVAIFNGVAFTNYTRATNDLVCTNCSSPSPGDNGRVVAYAARSATDGITNVYWKDMTGGNVELISATMSGAPGNGPSFDPLLTPDGRFVVFTSRASDLVPGDNNRATDIFARDRWAGVTHCLSRNFAGTGTGNRVSSNPIMSTDGRTIAFHSFASDLLPGDYNDTRDVFVVTIGGPDVDTDGMDDDWEMAWFNTLTRDGSGDFDGDGASDRHEFGAGTNPTNNRSILSVVRFTMGQPGGQNGARTLVLVWNAVPGKSYQVESKTDLNSPWQPLGSPVEAATTSASATYQLDNDTLAAQPNAFYRVTVAQ